MKDSYDSTAVGRAPEPEGFTNRKLIRPSLNGRPEAPRPETPPERRERPATAAPARKPSPPQEQTHAENYYYLKQMQSKTIMTVVLQDGELLHGTIEWYDRCCIKMARDGGGTVVVYKPCIKYMYKQSEGAARR